MENPRAIAGNLLQFAIFFQKYQKKAPRNLLKINNGLNLYSIATIH